MFIYNNMKKLLILATCILLAFAPVYYFFKSYNSKIQQLDNQGLEVLSQKETYLNIFVHGSFGTMLGVLSLPKIAQDEVKETLYRQAIKKMRKNPSHFTEQPILNKGLIKINPTFDTALIGNKKLAAYPILKAYEIILNQTNPLISKSNYFYTFGWTGLMSQNRRRLEAIRFYNELSEELEEYNKQGINPKIRIIAHSHGGNLCLNMAAINKIMQLSVFIKDKKWANDQYENEALDKMCKLITSLPNKEFAKKQSKMKKFDYLPLNKNFNVSELILLGSPIQPETENFCTYDFFEKIYNFYSAKDFIQSMDFISTKQGFSTQKISNKIAKMCNQNSKCKLIQGRIMINNDWTKAHPVQPTITIKNGDTMSNDNSLLTRVISSAQTYFSDGTNDPTHKDFWFVDWEKENGNIFTHLPIVIFVPLFLQAITRANMSCTATDYDVNLTQSGNKKYLKIQVSKYNEFKKISEAILPINIIEDIKLNLKKWTPL